ncbi:MAG: radical SAM protein [Candidatus Omnitrophica bacterium]|nr:radical SAM protein [Candidatus Omnitrophota bacterium]
MDNHKKPSFCDLIITESCILKCKMCKMWQRKNEDELDYRHWLRFIDSFADFVNGKAQVQFVGGEPLLKKGILDLIKHADKRGLTTTMTTNSFLLNDDFFDRIMNSGLDTLVLSLDSLEKQTHDFLRGVDGVYERVMETINRFSRKRNNLMRLHIVTTIMHQNLDDISELAEWANQHDAIANISFQAITQPFFTPPDNEWYRKKEYSFLWPSDLEKVNFVLERLKDLKEKGYKITNPPGQFHVFKSYFEHPELFVKMFHCNLGYNSLSVNAEGKIFLCLSLEPIGNIRENKDIEEIWFSEKAEIVRNNIRNCKSNCKSMINCFFENEKTNATESNE